MNLNINQLLRPIRLVFLIQPNKKRSYLRAVRVCSSLWGGIYCPIFPLFKKFKKDFRSEYGFHKSTIDFYSKSIENYDPDFIVIDENVESNFVEKIKGDRDVISLKELEESIYTVESKYGICIDDIILSLKTTEFKFDRNDDLKLVLPKVKETDLFTATLFGSANAKNFEKLKSIPFPKKFISFPKVSPDNFSVFSCDNAMHFLKVCHQYIYSFGNPLWTSQTAVFIIDPDRLNDLTNFWNLRALGWKLLAIPYNDYKKDYYKQQLITQQKEFIEQQSIFDNISVLIGWNIDEFTVNEIVSYLNSIQVNADLTIRYINHWWIPRFWMDKNNLKYDKCSSVSIRSKFEKHTLNLNDQQIQIPLLSPDFGRKFVRHTAPRFVNEIYYEFDDIEARYAQIIPAIPSKEMDIVIKGSGFNQWRFSENGMFFLSQSNDEYINFAIPKAIDIFDKWFKGKGYKIQQSPIGKLSYQLLKNIGGIYGTNFFANPAIIPVLSLFENGKIVKQKSLFGEISKQRKHFRQRNLKDVVAHLLDKNIIQFGVELQCTYCNQHSFYELKEFQETVKCTICQTRFSPPLHDPENINWAYRGIGTFSRNNKSEGIISVLLTLRFFRIAMRTSSITPILNFEIVKEDKVINEVDFAVFLNKFKSGFSAPDLFFCECKTEIDFAKKDVDRMEKLARLFPSSILVFATLKNQLSESEKIIISALAKKFRIGLGSRPLNPILILTGNELLSWLIYDQKIKHLIIPHQQFSDEIGHLCDVTNQYYLGLPSYTLEVEKRFEAKMKKLYGDEEENKK